MAKETDILQEKVKKIADDLNNYTFRYPLDCNESSPFLQLSSYNFRPLIDARQYFNDITSTTNKSYICNFLFYVPNSLKFSYSPRTDEVTAVMDREMATGKDIIKGALNTGVNKWLLDTENTSMIGKVKQLFKDVDQQMSGMIFDPKQLQMFKDPGYLSFNLDFQLIPQSSADALSIQMMIETLKNITAPSAGDERDVKEWMDGLIGITKRIASDAKIDTKNKESVASKAGAEVANLVLDNVSEVTIDSMEKIKQLINNIANKNGIRTTLDTWKHPQLFDIYVMSPSFKDGNLNANNYSEFSLFRPAKGLIMNGLDINPISSSSRLDVPFYQDGLPIGYDISMRFTTISKYMNKK